MHEVDQFWDENADLLDALEDSPRGGTKHDVGKVRMDLLQWEALTEVAKVMTYGAKKYDAHNWRLGFSYSRVIGATFRHFTAWVTGQDKDPETGLSHLAHAACCILFLLTFELTRTGHDDRYKYPETNRDIESAD